MFTGIIEAVGNVAQVEAKQGDLRLSINSGALSLDDVRLGDSIATNGVCLTVVELHSKGFIADVSRESLSHTCIGQWRAGTLVNLEKALQASSRLGGHIVSGHVDGVAKIAQRSTDARSVRFTLEIPPALRKYVAAKGSITVDGVSLTTNQLTANGAELNIVPHTAAQTTLHQLKVGDSVHIEVDLIARYLEQLSRPSEEQPASTLTPAFLAQHGFWK